jgi:hypothetical protein
MESVSDRFPAIVYLHALWDAADALMLLVIFPQLGLFTCYHQDMARVPPEAGGAIN